MIFISSLTFGLIESGMVNVSVSFYVTKDYPVKLRFTEFTISAGLLYDKNYQVFQSALDFVRAALEKEKNND